MENIPVMVQEINFIWISSPFDSDKFLQLLSPKLSNLRYFFNGAYKDSPIFNLWIDRDMDKATLELLKSSGVHVRYISEIYENLEKFFKIDDVNLLRWLVSIESGMIVGEKPKQYYPDSNKQWKQDGRYLDSKYVETTFKPIPAIAADILRFALLFLKPSWYMDLGLETKPIFLKSKEWGSHVPCGCIDPDTGRIRSDAIFAASYSYKKTPDLQILMSTDNPKCKKIFGDVLQCCIDHPGGRNNLRNDLYRTPYEYCSWTYCYWLDVLKSHNLDDIKYWIIPMFDYSLNLEANFLCVAKDTDNKDIKNKLINDFSIAYVVKGNEIYGINGDELTKALNVVCDFSKENLIPGNIYSFKQSMVKRIARESGYKVQEHSRAFAGFFYKERNNALISDYKQDLVTETAIDTLLKKSGDDKSIILRHNDMDLLNANGQEKRKSQDDWLIKYNKEKSPNRIGLRISLNKENILDKMIKLVVPLLKTINLHFLFERKCCWVIISEKNLQDFVDFELSKIDPSKSWYIILVDINRNVVSIYFIEDKRAALVTSTLNAELLGKLNNLVKNTKNGLILESNNDSLLREKEVLSNVQFKPKYVKNAISILFSDIVDSCNKIYSVLNGLSTDCKINDFIIYFQYNLSVLGCVRYGDRNKTNVFKSSSLSSNQILQNSMKIIILLYAYKMAEKISSVYFRDGFYHYENYKIPYINILKMYSDSVEAKSLIILLESSRSMAEIDRKLKLFIDTKEKNNPVVSSIKEIFDLNKKMKDADKILQYSIRVAIKTGDLVAIQKLLNEQNYAAYEVVNTTYSENGNTFLMLAVDYNNEAIVAELLKIPNIDVNKPSLQGWTPLMLAVAHGNAAMVKLLFESGAKDGQSNTHDHSSALDLVKYLENKGMADSAQKILQLFKQYNVQETRKFW